MNIKIDNIEITLTPEQVATLCKAKESKIFPQDGDIYWYYLTNGIIRSSRSNDSNKRINAYRTKEEAIEAKDIAFAEDRLKHAIAVANSGWTPDWSDMKTSKYYIYLDYKNNLEIRHTSWLKFMPNWLCIKSMEAAKKVIAEHREDLELVLGR